ncbi:MAG: 3TM-type holin [Pseudomonadota bacterium]
MIPFLAPVIGAVSGVIDKVVKDKDLAEQLKHEIAMQDFKLASQQIEVNVMEAQHKSIFVAGWRPWIGWVCGVAIAYTFIGAPFISYAVSIFAPDIPPPPQLETDQIFELVLAMLGMSGLRSFEKIKGVASSHIASKK